ncbi:hypothetical protein ACNOYE_06130 [Nannocystaceae bacterium ST9]
MITMITRSTRAKLRVALVLSLGLVLSCQERLADGEAEDLWTICTIVNAASVYDEQGNPVKMVGGPNGGNTPVCLCLTIEEKKSGEYDDYFNDEALKVCLENATRMGYPEDNDCAYWHEEGQWIEMIGGYPVDEPARCEEPDGSGCSVR